MTAGPAPLPERGELLRDPHARLAIALVASLVLWAPFGMAALRSDLDVVTAGIRYLVAFLGCRVAVGGIAHLLVSYRALVPVPEARTVAVDDAAISTVAVEDQLRPSAS